MVDDAITRWDVTFILLDLISDLSAGHTYAGGGDVEQTENRPTGFLGIDWLIDQGRFKIKRIVTAAPWDNEVRSPLSQPAVNAQPGEFILAVNGKELNVAADPYAAFDGLSGKTISLTLSKTPSMDNVRIVVIEALTPQQEARLRHLEWIEGNRKKVEQASGGQLAYLYMPNTGTEGQTELLRQFYAQIDKKGFVIDERFNAGGQLSDRFLEMLNRSTLYYIGWRNGNDMAWPIKGNNGPKVMLINGWAGSGGDAFPWGFQEMKLGPIIGERTVGILVGPATGHQLIDNGYITVPDARLFGTDGKWFAEGHGIEPTIEVWDDPAALAKGNDPQLDRAIEEAMKLIQTSPRKIEKRPPYENRTAQGIKD
jgi:tricorn protease